LSAEEILPTSLASCTAIIILALQLNKVNGLTKYVQQ